MHSLIFIIPGSFDVTTFFSISLNINLDPVLAKHLRLTPSVLLADAPL